MISTSLPRTTRVWQRPLDMKGTLAQRAIAASLEALGSPAPATDREQGLIAHSVERDDLGMVHVRLNRFHEGLKVLGEQVVTHFNDQSELLGITGAVKPIREGISRMQNLSAEDAIARAVSAFGARPPSTPTAELLIAKDKDDKLGYRLAYRVECVDLRALKQQNYLIDALTGRVMRQWNAIAEADHGEGLQRAPAAVKTFEQSLKPGQRIDDYAPFQSSLFVSDSFRAGKIQLELDIDHEDRSDLDVYLTSPSGKKAVISDRESRFGEKNLKGTFDLYTVFDGETVKGDWTLHVKDWAKGDHGTLNSWKLTLVEREPPVRLPSGTDDQSMYSGLVDLAATRTSDGRYELVDRSRGLGVETRDAMNNGPFGTSKPIYDDNNIWGEATDDPRQRAAIDAHHGAQMTYDFLRDVVGRDSIDGRGEKLVNHVHYGLDVTNASWDGKKMNLGDGDGDGTSAFTALDVVGHEITHGLTQRTAQLQYFGESGGLNESMSDIIGGAGLDWYALQKNPSLEGKVNPFVIGEQFTMPGKKSRGLRDLANPTADGYSLDHYDGFDKSDKEVHRTSGIANNAFSLLTQGGKNKTSGVEVKDPIGVEKGLWIFSRALVNYMVPTTTFAQAREATLQAAADLFGPNAVEVEKVKEAWAAVGVKGEPATVESKPASS